MESKNASHKKPKAAQTKAAPPAERLMAGDSAEKPRRTRLLPAKKVDTAEMISGKHHHKPATPPSAKTKPLTVDNTPERMMQAVAVDHERIAKLAHSYWVERGYIHGSHEDDWKRAERELGIQ